MENSPDSPRKFSDYLLNPFILQKILYLVFKGASLRFFWDKGVRRLIQNEYDTFNKTIALHTRDRAISIHLKFKEGRMEVHQGLPAAWDVAVIFKNPAVIRELSALSPDGLLNYLLTNQITFQGNLSYLLKFAYILNTLFPSKIISQPKLWLQNIQLNQSGEALEPVKKELNQYPRGRLSGKRSDKVKFLEDPYLKEYSLFDFPNLLKQREVLFATRPSVCIERAQLLTTYFKETGFEVDSSQQERSAISRQAGALHYILSRKKPILTPENLLAGTTTKKPIGVILYPEGHGLTLWPELKTIAQRKIQPYDLTPAEATLLDEQIFPFWYERNVREYTRLKNHSPRYQALDERFVLYFMWKTVALSHTIPDFPMVLAHGITRLIEIAGMRKSEGTNPKEQAFCQGVQTALQGVLAYARHLRELAENRLQEGGPTLDEAKKAYYQRIILLLERVPAFGARTLPEAVQSLWILWVALHNESTNAGLSLGHLDVWLQPYFESDLAQLKTDGDRQAYVRQAIALIGDFFLKCQDHLPLVADVGNKLFGGSSSDQALTIGGVDALGETAVCDMTYIFLKVTEMLSLRDPNLNARFAPGVNSEIYLKRLIEVNFVTRATPSIHNDQSMIRALTANGFKLADAREWVATGCVEPTIPGRHFGHTNSMMFNLVAALEMTLYNGVHPLLEEQVGPKTGDVKTDALPRFEDFFKAFTTQLRFLADQAVDYNNALGISHQVIRPTPILSSMFTGPLDCAKDLTEGGALYNTSGVACIGLTDIIDSLITIKTLVYDEKRVNFSTLLKALAVDFKGYEKLYALILNKIPKFGSDHLAVNEMAQQVVDMIYEAFFRRLNYRGGHYLVGFWSMSNHVAFGNLSGALPSGRKKHRPFTPGLTPENARGVDLISSIRTIAALNPEKMPNNIAFNVKIAPDSKDTFEETIAQVMAYTKTYFELGGLQIQFNMITTETLIEALNHPENYRHLLVRISGYNAYFVELNREMQQEIIDRQQIRV